ncbi:tRNA (adenine(58)-N(1))-methyltransferase non-catalytic subunit TRM6 [Anguilla rostrata]|uniref:tRNA (adenine(58)-N(1))-methyltransferase non-catalytic subunit TRM6 n=1 Tax=Anguilla rostrata TaxID=7938 RepID=UPI0030D2E44B
MANNVDDSPDALCTIGEGDCVVLKRGDIFKAAQIQKNRKVIFEKQWFFLDNAVGELYGTAFEVASGGTLQPKKPKLTESITEVREAGTDNRNIVDDGTSQKLTRDDIETLKGQGLKGQDIVQQLVENSSSFRDKTEFAQEKYIKKKKKKYENTVTILKPSTRILAQMYHGREPGKICHLRYDSLAQMLTLGNIHAGSKVIVFETCAGLVLGAVMERMGGHGSVIQMYPGGGPVRAATDSFGFPKHFLHTLHDFPLCKVQPLLAGQLSLDAQEPDAPPQPNPEGRSQESGGGDSTVEKMESEMERETDDREKRREDKAQERKMKNEEKRKKQLAVAALLQPRNADGLVIASRLHPCPVLLALLKFMAPSRPFVVYSQYREPLIECYTKLREQGGTINLQLTETWLRHYQVLPNRTHPVLLMSGGGGYILSGTTVMAGPPKPTPPQSAEEPSPKRIKLQEADG